MKTSLAIAIMGATFGFATLQTDTSSLGPEKAEAANRCYGGVVVGATASAFKASKARSKARSKWHKSATKKMGSSRGANWDIARNRDHWCKRRLGLMTCQAVGKPCWY